MKKKLRILIANWTWYPSGGDWTYIENLCRFYESLGHEVIPFSMQDDRNFPTPYAAYFIDKIDYKVLNQNKSILNGIKTVKKTIYSSQAKEKIRALLDKYPVDVAHLNNVHHYLTPASVIPEIRKRNIPIVWTLHDYVILCPNTTFTTHEKICEKCKIGKFYQCVVNTCKKGSTAASAVAALEAYANNYYNPYKMVDYFICPSEFIRQKFESYGFDRRKLVKIYNLFDTESLGEIRVPEFLKNPSRPYAVYVGRVEKVKGVLTMAEAFANLNADLYIIGAGETSAELREMVHREGWTNIHPVGKLPKEEVFGYVKNAGFVTVPSEWYENLPYSLVEALLLSKPVLGANIGGIPELVIDNITGLLFQPGDAADMRAKIQLLLSDPENLRRMGGNAKTHITEMVNYHAFGNDLSKIFNNLRLTL